MAAAEAAATGGKRIKRVWEKMKRFSVTGSSKKNAMEKKSGEIPGGSILTNSLRHGTIFAEQRGPAWVAVACADTETDLLSRSNYKQLLKQPAKAAKEIERDVTRTFPLHSKFREEAGQKALFNVIKAYSVWDAEVGYCQGMGFIAATLLMHMEEEDAFCCLVYLLYRCGLRGVFLPDMEQLQVRLYQLSQLVLECLPRLNAHFEDLEIKPVMYAADWFLTLFARTFPSYIVLRVFDIIIAERTAAIVFKLAIVMLQVCRRQVLQCPEMEFVMHFLRSELPAQLKELQDRDMEELIAKALRVELPFESLMRLEAEYELLAEEAATAAREVQEAARASEAAAASWEESRLELEERLLLALQAQQEAEAKAAALQKQVDELMERRGETGERQSKPGSSMMVEANGGPHSEEWAKPFPRSPLVRKFTLSEEEVENTRLLLRTVNVLRREKAAIVEALGQAEQALGEKLRQDNQKATGASSVGSGSGSFGADRGDPIASLDSTENGYTADPRISKAAMGYRDTELGQLLAGQQAYSNPDKGWAKE